MIFKFIKLLGELFGTSSQQGFLQRSSQLAHIRAGTRFV